MLWPHTRQIKLKGNKNFSLAPNFRVNQCSKKDMMIFKSSSDSSVLKWKSGKYIEEILKNLWAVPGSCAYENWWHLSRYIFHSIHGIAQGSLLQICPKWSSYLQYWNKWQSRLIRLAKMTLNFWSTQELWQSVGLPHSRFTVRILLPPLPKSCRHTVVCL